MACVFAAGCDDGRATSFLLDPSDAFLALLAAFFFADLLVGLEGLLSVGSMMSAQVHPL